MNDKIKKALLLAIDDYDTYELMEFLISCGFSDDEIIELGFEESVKRYREEGY